MEDYINSVIPLLPQIMPAHESEAIMNDEKTSNSKKRCRDVEANGCLRKGKEKRKEMSESFDILQALIPNLSPKATREKIVSGTIEFIEFLQKQLMRLEMQVKKPSDSVTTIPSPDGVIVSVSGNIALFGILTLVRRGLLTQILMVFERHGAEVLAANVAVFNGELTITITASVNGYIQNTVEQIKNDILMLKN